MEGGEAAAGWRGPAAALPERRAWPQTGSQTGCRAVVVKARRARVGQCTDPGLRPEAGSGTRPLGPALGRRFLGLRCLRARVPLPLAVAPGVYEAQRRSTGEQGPCPVLRWGKLWSQVTAQEYSRDRARQRQK